MKVRKVDFYPDEWLAGTVDLSDAERGVYITLCMMIYSRGGPVSRERLQAGCRSHGNAFNHVLGRLIGLGKVLENGSELSVKRCEIELERAHKRLEKAHENGEKGGRPPNKHNKIDKPVGLVDEKLAGATTNYQLPTNTLSNESVAREARRSLAAEFERWWVVYPNKIGKGAAKKAFEKARKKISADELVAGVRRYDALKPADREWCNPATWLNQDRWLDEPAPKLNGAGANPSLPLLDPPRRPQGPPPERL